MRRESIVLATAFLLIVLLCEISHADPCGMVPPVSISDEIPIARIGVQKTYVFYKGGLETFIIQPGFAGSIDEFGMLIPFPAPPAIRKMPDSIFAHITAAIDPPEVVVDLQPQPGLGAFGGAGIGGGGGFGGRFRGLTIAKDQVHVVREQAVGMYQTVVLAAGSPKALKRWMDDHSFRYPKGMDIACNDYIEAGWCFVAVKAKVGMKGGVDPKPGMRKTNAKMPAGAAFDGHVQAMGFRFRSHKLVVPMRLSAYNKGELRNIIYLLSDRPVAVRSLPTKMVVRQIAGPQLYKNLTDPLPLRVIGAASLTRRGVKTFGGRFVKIAGLYDRDPKSKNGLARELFASDLIAYMRHRLSLPFEDAESNFVQIGERLGLRGPEIDGLNRKNSEAGREKSVRRSLRYLKQMTLTVIDGDFPRDLLARQNLTFTRFTMPVTRNTPQFYDAKKEGPLPRKKKGLLILGKMAAVEKAGTTATASTAKSVSQPSTPSGTVAAIVDWKTIAGVSSCLLMGLVVVYRGKMRRRRVGS